jgi:hypothetical protein
LKVSLLTSCCNTCFEGASLGINGKQVIPMQEDGCLPVKKRKRAGELALRIENVPEHLLPGSTCAISKAYGPYDTMVQVDVECNLWFYWTPPDQEEMEWFQAGDTDEPPEGMVFVAANPDQVPEDAKPLSGSVKLPGSVEVLLDGTSMGPFKISPGTGTSSSAGALKCVLGEMQLSTEGPKGFTYREKYPAPLAERVDELGGCELQRLIDCPTALGFLKPAT